MASAPATPPKFVPTLTDEVSLPADPRDALAAPDKEVPGGYELPAGQVDDEAELAESTEIEAPALDSSKLPVLTEVAKEAEVEAAETSNQEEASLPQAPVITGTLEEPAAQTLVHASPLPDGYEEYVVHRVMQRVDVMLEQRLREAIANVIQEQTRSIVPRLREEVESVVRQSVYEAVADELASNHK